MARPRPAGAPGSGRSATGGRRAAGAGARRAWGRRSPDDGPKTPREGARAYLNSFPGRRDPGGGDGCGRRGREAVLGIPCPKSGRAPPSPLPFPSGETILEGGRSLFPHTKEGIMNTAERERLIEEIGELARAYDMKF